MFPKWQNPGRKSDIVLTCLQIVCLSKAMPSAFSLLEDVVLNEVYKEIVAPAETWGRGDFSSQIMSQILEIGIRGTLGFLL